MQKPLVLQKSTNVDINKKKALFLKKIEELREREKTFRSNPKNSKKYWKELKNIICTKGDFNLSNYRDNYLDRRIRFRLKILKIKSFADYIDLIKQNINEIDEVKKILTIHTTEWFRDKTPWVYVEKVLIKKIIEVKRSIKDKTIRILSAPGSSGQEPYTLSIIIEELSKKGLINNKVEIYACDVSKNILESAKLGQYTKNYFNGIPSKYLKKYFKMVREDVYEISPIIRKRVKFFIQDLFKPLPVWIRNMDLICCRNLLIYISKENQLLVIRNLQRVLRNKGFLMLGKTESLLVINKSQRCNNLIAENAREHIYQYVK